MPKTVLLTGITGFLGSHLARQLLHWSNYSKTAVRLLGLKRKTSSFERLGELQLDIVWYDSEIATLSTIFKTEKVDVIIHTATCYGRQQESIATLHQTNVVFPLRLLELAVSHGVTAFLNTDTSLFPRINAYALSKTQLREWGQWFVEDNRDLKFINLSLEHFFGPNDSSLKFVSYVLSQCLQNEPTLALTAGEQQRDFIYIQDVVSAYMTILGHLDDFPRGFHPFEVGTGSTISLRNLVERIHEMVDSQTILKFGAIPYRDHEVMHSVANIEPLQALGWLPMFTLDAGLRQTVSAAQLLLEKGIR